MNMQSQGWRPSTLKRMHWLNHPFTKDINPQTIPSESNPNWLQSEGREAISVSPVGTSVATQVREKNPDFLVKKAQKSPDYFYVSTVHI